MKWLKMLSRQRTVQNGSNLNLQCEMVDGDKGGNRQSGNSGYYHYQNEHAVKINTHTERQQSYGGIDNLCVRLDSRNIPLVCADLCK